jgi:hypothetical protein
MWRMRGPSPFLSAAFGVVVLAACASGQSYTETLLQQIHPVDAVVVGSVLYIGQAPDLGWDAKVSEATEHRFTIEIERASWNGSGEGDFSRRFVKEARRIASERGCSGFRILAYSERYEPALIWGRSVAEGTIECV